MPQSRGKFWHTVCAVYFSRERSRGIHSPSDIRYTRGRDITLRAFEKYRALKILQKYLQETFLRYFSVVAYGREIPRVYTCKRYDLEREGTFDAENSIFSQLSVAHPAESQHQFRQRPRARSRRAISRYKLTRALTRENKREYRFKLHKYPW